MAIHPEFVAMAARAAELPPIDLAALPPLEIARLIRAGGLTHPPPAHTATRSEDVKIPGPDGNEIRLRLYRPNMPGRLGAVVNFHGGGWVTGSIETDDYRCHLLAAEANCLVVSVNYRLAPEHPFPAPLDDCLAATGWVYRQTEALGIDARRIAVTGSSSGANLAAAVAAIFRDEKLAPETAPIAFQCLIYPPTEPDGSFASWQENAGIFPLPAESMRWFWRQYLGNITPVSPRAAVLRLPHFVGLPPALIVTAEYDLLRDESEAYAHKLNAAGVPITLIRVPEMVHGFLTLNPFLPASRKILTAISTQLKSALAPV